MQDDSGCIDQRPKRRLEASAQPLVQQPFQAVWPRLENRALPSAADSGADLFEHSLNFGDHESAAGLLNPGCNTRKQKELIYRRDFSQGFEPYAVGIGHTVISTQQPGGVNLGTLPAIRRSPPSAADEPVFQWHDNC